MIKNNYIILTGAMGAGKTAVLNKLKEMNFNCVDEPARQILAEQRSIQSKGVPETDPELFIQLMLSRTMFQYRLNSNLSEAVFFDRGIADFIAYADLFNLDKNIFYKAEYVYKFNKNVFMFNAWKDIYINDEERKMSCEQAESFGRNVKEIYLECGYLIHDVPFDTVENRAEYIIDKSNSLIDL